MFTCFTQDPHETLREQCGATHHCQALSEKLEQCNDRVNSKKKTTETCIEELYDYIHCVDHCVSYIYKIYD